MQTTLTDIIFIAVCIIFICMTGCIDNNKVQEPGTKVNQVQKHVSTEEKNSSFIITRDGIPLRYAIHGQGPLVFFVLGLGMTIDEWPHKMIENLAQNHTVIVYNHRGVSGVHNPEIPFSISQGAMDLHEVITQLAGGNDRCGSTDNGLSTNEPVKYENRNCSVLPVDIVGYSMGGMIALEYAKTYPVSVNHLVLISTDCGGTKKVPADPWVIEEMGKTFNSPEKYLDRAGRLLLTEEFRTSHPDPSTWFVDYGEVADPGAVKEQYESFLSWKGVYPDLPSIQCRTLVITGDQDLVIPPENAVIIADAIPNATLVIREGQGHGMIFVEPEEIAGIIGEFLEGRVLN
ncbi:alpha/beta hydrolase [Methanospirillum hungatei]|uniref:alpha/beta fold hydrolase n=1 Tax=Methanospirillum hungatei TaxID=2203 RepID=UPI0026F2F531|nr:alpha/beta hydrolase [Methanospirillum hungatei]MCA1917548.1 alpha/beta hydrolase [Methanospirillum hungatei]